MKTQKLKGTEYTVSRLVMGCMRTGGAWEDSDPDRETIDRALALFSSALEDGINHFDHADIYGRGRAEKVFSHVWTEGLARREELVIQTKCGIRFPGDPEPSSPGRYDFSAAHILSSVEGSLRRLKTDYLDILLLHRPDPLADPDEIAAVFDDLQRAGKVRFFGVSNYCPDQIALLQKSVRQKLIINQVQFNLAFAHVIEAGIVAGYGEQAIATRGEGVLEYCRLHDITVQAYAPLAEGRFTRDGCNASSDGSGETAALIVQLAAKYGVSAEAILLAWILRLPGGIQPVIGTTDPQRLRHCGQSTDFELSREDWYALFTRSRGRAVP
jgi:predicted oxidoreductase